MAKRSLFPTSSHSPHPVVKLSELEAGEEGDCFVLLAEKLRSETRDGKPYFRCQFRDLKRSTTAMIWHDSSWFDLCDTHWKVGQHFKIRCRYSENQYGSQIEMERVREVTEQDHQEGFDPKDFQPHSRFDVEHMFEELMNIVEMEMNDQPLRHLVFGILEDHQEKVKDYPAASRNHHAYLGGFLEHVLSVTRTAVYLADKYREYYPHLEPPLSKDLVVAGAVLHDIGKIQELSSEPHGAEYTAEGRLVGHILLGRDIVREKAKEIPEMDRELLLRLEHVIIAHQNLPEWGSPIAPHTPEALLVHYADDIDAKFQMMVAALNEPAPDDAEFTSRQNPLRRAIFRGFPPSEK